MLMRTSIHKETYDETAMAVEGHRPHLGYRPVVLLAPREASWLMPEQLRP